MKIFIRFSYDFFISNVSTLTIFTSPDMLVSKLKDLIYEKNRMHPSQQKLTTKIADLALVMLTNDWPLSFFNIKENSIIFLEYIQEVDKNAEIQKKLLSGSKTKYLKSLGLLNKRLNPGLGVITESPNEYNDEIVQKNKGKFKSSQTYTEEETTEIVIEAVRNNNLQQFKELFEQYDNINVDTVAKKTGWNALHYSCFYGYVDLVEEIINNRKADYTKSTTDGWTPLHLSCHKGHVNVVRILLSKQEININLNLGSIGTPLHCACKKNHLQVVSLLIINQVDLRIQDSNGALPIDLTSDQNIKKLIKKCLKFQTKNIDPILKYPFLKQLPFIPPKPPKTKGNISKTSRYLARNITRFIEIDPVNGSFRRYESYEKFQSNPLNPLETIPLKDIIHCKKISDWTSSSFEIMYKYRQIYKTDSDELCDKWIERINAAIIYNKFWMNLIEKNSEIADYYLKQSDIEEFFPTTLVHKKAEKEEEKAKENQESNNKESVISNKPVPNSTETTNKTGLPSAKTRRKNPHSKTNESNTEDEEDEKLLDDSSITKGVNYSSFEFLELLGQGSFGKVIKVRLKSTGEIFAMKILNKKNLIKSRLLRYAVTECNVLKRASHPFIISLHYAFQTPEHLYMVIDYCSGGDLSFHINKNLFEENEAKFFIAELVLAIEHLHSLDVIYRDLKPENILISNDGHIKLADFGLAKEGVSDNNVTGTFCGSNAYLSPEMVNHRGVGKAADIYGVGAILYEMLTGLPPFFTTNLDQLFNNISKNELKFPDYFSNEVKLFLKGITMRDPKKRLGVNSKDDIKKHPFFKEINWNDLINKKVQPPINLVEIKNEIESEIPNELKESIKFTDRDYDDSNADMNRVIKYTFARKAT